MVVEIDCINTTAALSGASSETSDVEYAWTTTGDGAFSGATTINATTLLELIP
jgi:hypothetical protein